ncbi:MAG: hypothetical protein M9894_28680 [Planctomycetes bacterium]|nr:hypothetical protein [Planctomycetota bacterium]
MTDARRRALERRVRATAGLLDEAALLLERARSGDLPAERLALAALCGHPAAAAALDVAPEEGPLHGWPLRALARFDGPALVALAAGAAADLKAQVEALLATSPGADVRAAVLTVVTVEELVRRGTPDLTGRLEATASHAADEVQRLVLETEFEAAAVARAAREVARAAAALARGERPPSFKWLDWNERTRTAFLAHLLGAG